MWLLDNDKVLHFVAGFIIAYAAFFLTFVVFALNPWICLLVAGAVSALVLLGKELVWDKLLGKGAMNWKDFYAGCIGDAICIAAIALMLLSAL